MAQLPASMRRKRAAITSIHEKTAYAQAKTCQCRRMGVTGYCLLVLAVGIYGLYKVITDATVAKT